MSSVADGQIKWLTKKIICHMSLVLRSKNGDNSGAKTWPKWNQP